jgi:glycosyltransferase involved in cell wall biosynthesis
VLFLPRWYPNRYDPMPGLFIERHARAVASYYRVAVLYVHQDDRIKSGSIEIDQVKDDEIFQVRIYYGAATGPGVYRSLVNTFRFLKCHIKGLRIIRKEMGARPDLVHVNVLTRLGVIAMIYKWFTGTPYVITEHWTRYLPHMDNFKGSLQKRMTRMAVKDASAVLPVTDNLRQAMEAHGLKNKNYRIIPNVVDMEMFRTGEYLPEGKVHFIHVSCFEDKQKNISGILRVLKRLSEKRADWKCTLIGDGIHFEQLKEYARELGIEGKYAFFTGLRENEELAQMMRDAAFQLMFSRFENLPVVILESFASGVPVLSTDVGGIREHLHPELGILINSEDEAALEEKIDYLLDHFREYSKENLREYARAHFSREVIGRQLADVYSSILKAKN